MESAKLLMIGPCQISYITSFYHRLATWCCSWSLLKTTSMLYSTHVHHFLVTTHIFFCSVCCACKLESLGADFHKRVVLPFIFLHIKQIWNTSKYWKQDFKCIQSVFLRMCATQSGTYTQWLQKRMYSGKCIKKLSCFVPTKYLFYFFRSIQYLS